LRFRNFCRLKRFHYNSQKKDDIQNSKVIRGFTSEIIEILRKDTDTNELKEISIRGDCVLAVYSTPNINTYMRMLNKLLEDRSLPNVKAGIRLSTSVTLAVKADRKSSGKAVSTAAKLAELGNKNGINPIVCSKIFMIILSNYKKKNIRNLRVGTLRTKMINWVHFITAI
jgi:hypothetical protein